MRKVCKDTYLPMESLYRSHERETLRKMYPNENLDGKIILFLDFQLYWPYNYLKIEADLIILEGKIFKEEIGDSIIDNLYGEVEVPKTKVRMPFPNKAYKTISMSRGTAVSGLGVPVVFDSFEDIVKVKQITCKWKIICEDMDYYIYITYDVSFKAPIAEDEWIFGIQSRDMPIKDACDAYEKDSRIFGNTINEFDYICHLSCNADTPQFDYYNVLGTNCDWELLSATGEPCWREDEVNRDFEIFLRYGLLATFTADPDRTICIDLYHATEELKPATFSYMIFHY